jgi:hypothetical protein
MQFIDRNPRKVPADIAFLQLIGCGMVAGALTLIGLYFSTPASSIAGILVAVFSLAAAGVVARVIRKKQASLKSSEAGLDEQVGT